MTENFTKKLYEIAHQEISKKNKVQQELIDWEKIYREIECLEDMLCDGWWNEDKCIESFKYFLHSDTVFDNCFFGCDEFIHL